VVCSNITVLQFSGHTYCRLPLITYIGRRLVRLLYCRDDGFLTERLQYNNLRVQFPTVHNFGNIAIQLIFKFTVMKTLLHFLGWVTIITFCVWFGLVITGISVFQTYTIGMNIFSITTIIWVFSGLL